jgi:hypothetical protein
VIVDAQEDGKEAVMLRMLQHEATRREAHFAQFHFVHIAKDNA